MANPTQQAASPLSPLQELGKRFAEGQAGLQTAAFAVGLEDHRAMLADYRTRLMDGHRAMAKTVNAEVTPASEGDDMGGITVTGDNHFHYGTLPSGPAPASPAASPAAPSPATAAAGGLGTLAKLGIASALALGTGGAGAGLAAMFLTKAAPAAINSATGFNLELAPSGK